MKYLNKNLAKVLLCLTSFGSANADISTVSSCEVIDCCQECPSENCGNGFISGDLLYWRAYQSGLDVCVPTEVSDEIINGRVVSRFRGKGKEPNFRWDPGFRIGAGYGSAYSSWSYAAFWTHFNTHASHSNRVHWKLNFDTVDLLAIYKYDIGCVALRPFAGLRGARIDQKIRGVSPNRSSGSSIEDLTIFGNNNKHDFWAVGPLLGIEGDWGIGYGFSLYASAAVSWLYGNSHIRQREFESTPDTTNFYNVSRHSDANVACADAGLGIRWETCMFTNKPLLLQFGLEHHRYFDYNRFGHYGDLTFDGINLSAIFAY